MSLFMLVVLQGPLLALSPVPPPWVWRIGISSYERGSWHRYERSKCIATNGAPGLTTIGARSYITSLLAFHHPFRNRPGLLLNP